MHYIATAPLTLTFLDPGDSHVIRHPKRVWQQRTHPHHPFDKTLWPLLRPIMLLFAEGKISHWWHWRDLPLDFELKYAVNMPSDPQAFSIIGSNPLVKMFNRIRMSLGGWRQTVYLVPDADKVSAKDIEQGWRYGYMFSNGEIRICSIIHYGPISVLTGPDPFLAFGLKADSNQEIPLKAAGPLPRKIPIV